MHTSPYEGLLSLSVLSRSTREFSPYSNKTPNFTARAST